MFKINLPSKGINIKYIDLNTGLPIATPEKITGMINDKYDVTNLNKEISGYRFVETEGNLDGVLQKEATEVIYKYEKEYY